MGAIRTWPNVRNGSGPVVPANAERMAGIPMSRPEADGPISADAVEKVGLAMVVTP